MLALLGCALILLNVLWQLWNIATWGVRHDWHFRYVSGWGFAWVGHIMLHILALTLISPYWLFVRGRAAQPSLLGRPLVNSLVLIGLTAFVFVSMLERYLANFVP